MGRRGDRGQAAPLVLGVLALAVVVLLALVPLAQAARQRAEARTAADAAALAGAAAGEDEARAVAEANGAELVGWRAHGNEVWVAVTLGDARAVAKARARTVNQGASGRGRPCRTLDPMPTEEPVVAPPRDPAGPAPDAGTATFRAGAERADDATAVSPQPTAPPAAVAPARRRRFLDDPDPEAPKAPRAPKVRARKVRRIVRHIEPWSVLKVSVLFFLSIFLIICVASAVLWSTARSAGVIDDVESFITSLGFGNCEDIPGESAPVTTTTAPSTGDQLDPGAAPPATTAPPEASSIPDEDGDCAEGQRLVGGFEFEDGRIFQAFALGGVVLVLAGAAGSVVLAMLFNLISDLTGGVRVTVLEEEPVPRSGAPSGSPPASPRRLGSRVLRTSTGL